MTTIELNDPFIDQIAQQKGIEYLKNDILHYLKEKFTPKEEPLISAQLEAKIRALKPTNPQRAEKMREARRGLHEFMDPNKINMTLGEAREAYFNDKAKQNEY